MASARRTALVTGGGSGIGAATCARLARDGLAVGVLDIDAGAARRVAEEIQSAGGQALALVGDVSERADVADAAEALRARFGPVGVLVNNAAAEGFAPFEEIEDESWDRLMRVNLKGAYIVSQTVLPDMLAAGWGRIVNISSFGAQMGAARMVHYTASKGGVIAMTKSMALEFGARGVTVNSVSPGFILTPMSQRAIDEDLFGVPYEQILQSYPIPRIGRPDEVAAACAFFASEEAGYITGQVLGVNGGGYL